MKKFLALLLALAMLFALAACTDGNEENPTGTPTDGPTDAPPTDPPTDPPTEPPTDPADEISVMAGFTPTPAKYTRDEFVEALVEYVNGITPDRTTEHEDSPLEEEHGTKKTYYIMGFTEEHELNLFLHKVNNAEGKEANGWISADKFEYKLGDKTTYSVSVFYLIPCETLEEVVALAKNDAARVAVAYGFAPEDLKFTVTVKNKKTEINLSEGDFAKLASGEYSVVNGAIPAGHASGDSCKFEIDINKTADGKFEYVFRLRLQISA